MLARGCCQRHRWAPCWGMRAWLCICWNIRVWSGIHGKYSLYSKLSIGRVVPLYASEIGSFPSSTALPLLCQCVVSLRLWWFSRWCRNSTRAALRYGLSTTATRADGQTEFASWLVYWMLHLQLEFQTVLAIYQKKVRRKQEKKEATN